MTVQVTAAMLLSMAVSGWGGHRIQVYVNGGTIAPTVLLPAEDTASRMLATAAVHVDWHYGAPHSGEITGRQVAIVVNFSDDTAPNDHPGAMAYVRPYEGAHIVVFYDRMRQVPGRACAAGACAGP